MTDADPNLQVRLVGEATVAGVQRIHGPPDKPPRVLRIDHQGRCVAALHSEGTAVTARGNTDVRRRWRQGVSPAVLAADLMRELELSAG